MKHVTLAEQAAQTCQRACAIVDYASLLYHKYLICQVLPPTLWKYFSLSFLSIGPCITHHAREARALRITHYTAGRRAGPMGRAGDGVVFQVKQVGSVGSQVTGRADTGTASRCQGPMGPIIGLCGCGVFPTKQRESRGKTGRIG